MARHGNIEVLPCRRSRLNWTKNERPAWLVGRAGSKIPKSDVIRALIDRAGPIETGEDLINWVEQATGRGLGLAQTTK